MPDQDRERLARAVLESEPFDPATLHSEEERSRLGAGRRDGVKVVEETGRHLVTGQAAAGEAEAPNGVRDER
jgi:hypothetical protein